MHEIPEEAGIRIQAEFFAGRLIERVDLGHDEVPKALREPALLRGQHPRLDAGQDRLMAERQVPRGLQIDITGEGHARVKRSGGSRAVTVPHKIRIRRLEEKADLAAFDYSQLVQRGDMSAVGRIVQIERMIEGFAEPADATTHGLRRGIGPVTQNLPGELQESVVPQHERGNLENVLEHVLALGGADEGVQSVGQRDGHIGAKGLQRLDGIVNVNIVAAGEAGDVQIEHRRAQRAQLIGHFDGEVIIDAAKPPVRGQRGDDPQTCKRVRSSEIPLDEDAGDVNGKLRQPENPPDHAAARRQFLEYRDFDVAPANHDTGQPQSQRPVIGIPAERGRRVRRGNFKGQSKFRSGGEYFRRQVDGAGVHLPVVQRPLGHNAAVGLHHYGEFRGAPGDHAIGDDEGGRASTVTAERGSSKSTFREASVPTVQEP